MSLLLSLITLAGLALPPDDAAVIAAQVPLYPLDTCVVSGEPLDTLGKPLDVVQDGRLVRLCCAGCQEKLAEDPAAVLAALDRAAVAQQRAAYPLETCLVSGEAFGGAMGEPIELVHEGRYVKLCCGGCVKRVKADWDTLEAKLDQATIAAQKRTYPLSTCVVSDEPLGAGAVDVLHGVTLVRVCCKSCVKLVHKQPAEFLAAVAAARLAAQRSGADSQGDDSQGAGAAGEAGRAGAEGGASDQGGGDR